MQRKTPQLPTCAREFQRCHSMSMRMQQVASLSDRPLAFGQNGGLLANFTKPSNDFLVAINKGE